MKALRLGYSPCPNDTFLFYALVHGRVEREGLRFDPVLEDVETLNRWALDARLPMTKVSYGVLDRLVDRYWCLRSGGALGWGCGPLVVARRAAALETFLDGPVAVPGEHTTASLLLRLRAARAVEVVPMVFHEVMPAVAEGRVAAGVVIHEGRFTYRSHGLTAVEDLGAPTLVVAGGVAANSRLRARVAAACDAAGVRAVVPSPRGGIVLRRDIPGIEPRTVERVLRRSVEYALAHPEEPMEYVGRHAQEMEAGVLREHIGLYVNRYSIELGREGERAALALLERAATLRGRIGPAPEPFAP